MIGSAKLSSVAGAAGGVTPPPSYGVNLNPGSIDVESDRGAASSSTVTSDVIGGVGPFTYQWSITGSGIGINTPTSGSTKFNSSGSNQLIAETGTLTVTDVGNGNAETSKDITVTFFFIN